MKTAEEIADAILERAEGTAMDVRQALINAVNSGREGAGGSMVITSQETIEDNHVTVFDVDAFYQGWREYDEDDVASLVEGLRLFAWENVANDVEKFWKERTNAG